MPLVTAEAKPITRISNTKATFLCPPAHHWAVWNGPTQVASNNTPPTSPPNPPVDFLKNVCACHKQHRSLINNRPAPIFHIKPTSERALVIHLNSVWGLFFHRVCIPFRLSSPLEHNAHKKGKARPHSLPPLPLSKQQQQKAGEGGSAGQQAPVSYSKAATPAIL